MKKMKVLASLILIFICLLFVSACNTSINIRLNFEDGTLYKEVTGEKGLEVALENPEKEGHTFKGWYLGNDLVEAPYIFEDDMVLVAKFDINLYTYKFLVNGEVIKEETAEYNSAIQFPSTPSVPSTAEFTYTFAGWDKDDTVLKADIEFNAVFEQEKNQYTYKFIDYDGTVLKEEKVNYGTTPVAPENPTREATANYEYTFKSWDKEISAVTADIIYTALYDAKEIKFSTLEGKKVSILGDSISTFYAAGSEMNSYYSEENTFFYPRYSQSIKTVNLTWWYQLIKNNNMQLGINNSWSGSCASGSGSSSGASDGRINTIDDNGMPDVVIIYLGTNDCGSSYTTVQFGTAIETMITKIRALGDPQIYLTTLGYSAYKGGSYTDERRVEFNTKLRNIASDKNCGIIPLDEYVVEDNYMIYLEDSLHYNAKGALLLSKIMEKAIKDYNGITFEGEIEVEHQEPLPEGVVGMITATANSGFWTKYTTDIFFVASTHDNPKFAHRIEISKNADDGKYYVSKVTKNGDSSTFECDYVLIISSGHNEYQAMLKLIENVTVGNLVEFDETLQFPLEITFKTN